MQEKQITAYVKKQGSSIDMIFSLTCGCKVTTLFRICPTTFLI